MVIIATIIIIILYHDSRPLGQDGVGPDRGNILWNLGGDKRSVRLDKWGFRPGLFIRGNVRSLSSSNSNIIKVVVIVLRQVIIIDAVLVRSREKVLVDSFVGIESNVIALEVFVVVVVGFVCGFVVVEVVAIVVVVLVVEIVRIVLDVIVLGEGAALASNLLKIPKPK